MSQSGLWVLSLLEDLSKKNKNNVNFIIRNLQNLQENRLQTIFPFLCKSNEVFNRQFFCSDIKKRMRL